VNADAASKVGQAAVVEIGSTGIRMLLADIDGQGGFLVRDRAGKPLALGRDVFTTGLISRDTASRCLAILSGFREVLAGWGMRPEGASCIATSALREARNRDTFVDRVALQTGFRVETVEGIEEIRLMHLAIRHALREKLSETGRSNSMVIEVGGGSTELMLLRRNRIAAAHSFGTGTIRIQQQAIAATGSSRFVSRFIEESVATTCERLSSELRLETVKHFICIGSDARAAADRAGRKGGEAFWIVPREAFIDFANSVRAEEPAELAARLKLPMLEAEGMALGLHIARLYLDRTPAAEVIVPDASIREGMLVSLSQGTGGEEEEGYRQQVIAAAKALGRRCLYDEAHALHVASNAVTLYRALAPEHGLGPHEELLLEVGALLHDVGAFIKTSGHHKHSEYIVSNSEIFGLRRDDQAVIAGIVRYHRKQPPLPSHPGFSSLPPASRILVLKLAAILRVADALDRGHTQKVSIKAVERIESGLLLRTGSPADLSIERYGLAEKAGMLEDVFGLKVALA